MQDARCKVAGLALALVLPAASMAQTIKREPARPIDSVEGVDLYGGTRHSSASALRSQFSPEQIKRATMHSTNKAFERYFQTGAEDLRTLYAVARTDPRLTPENPAPAESKLLILQR